MNDRERRTYRRLLRLYPERFRSEHGAGMLQTFDDLRREARHRGAAGRVRLWTRTGRDLVVSALAERARSVGHPLTLAGAALTLRTTMIVNGLLFVAFGLSTIFPPGPVVWVEAFGIPVTAATGGDIASWQPVGVARFLGMVLMAFGVLLVAASSVRDAGTRDRIASAMCWSYVVAAGILYVQQTQIWLTAAGSSTVVVAAAFAVTYGLVALRQRRTASTVRPGVPVDS